MNTTARPPANRVLRATTHLRRHRRAAAATALACVIAAGALALAHLSRYAALPLALAGLAMGCAGRFPGAIVAIAVPVRASVPLLASLSWADSAILGAALAELHATWIPRRPRVGPIALFVALASCSLVYSIDRTLTIKALILLIEGLALATLARGYVARRSTGPDEFLRIWLILGLMSTFAALTLFYLATPLVWWNLQQPSGAALLLSYRLRLGSPFWGPSNYYASILLLFLPVAGAAGALGRHRALAITTGTFTLVAIYLTTSRGAILALAFGALAGLVEQRARLTRLVLRALARRRLRIVLAATLLAAIALLAGPPLVEHFFLSRDTAVGSFASGERGAIYRAGLSVAAKHLVVGVGYGAAPSAAPQLSGGTHNYGLTLLIELGVPGVLLGLWAWVGAMRHLSRAVRSPPNDQAGRALVAGALGALVLTTVNIQVEASFEGTVFFLLFASLMGAAVGTLRQAAAKDVLPGAERAAPSTAAIAAGDPDGPAGDSPRPPG